MISKNIFRLSTLAICLMFAACSEAQPEIPRKTPAQAKQDSLIDQNRKLLAEERARIDEFIAANHWQMKRTGSGLYYMVLDSANAKNAILEGDYIEYKYRITLLDGTPIRNAEEDGNREILVGKDQVEIGLHEAFLLSKLGSKMIFIFPAHLAHGLAGNTDNVPPRSTLIYEIEPLKKLND